MAKKNNYKWEEMNDAVLHDENPYDYITNNALDAIKNLEGHTRTEDAKFGGRVTRTSTYGITQEGLNGLDRLRFKYRVRIPERLVNAKLDDLSESDTRLAAAYTAMLNTKDIEEITNSKGFSKQSLAFRSGVLAALHTHGMYAKDFINSYNGRKDWSFLLACEQGNPYKILRTLLQDSKGNLQKEFQFGKDAGHSKRNLVGVLLALNPDLTWNDAEKKDWEPAFANGVFTKTTFNRLLENEKAYDMAKAQTDNLLYGMPEFKNLEHLQTPNENNEEEVRKAIGLANGEAELEPENPIYKLGKNIISMVKNSLGLSEDENNQVANDENNKYSDEEFKYKGTINLNNRPRVKNEDGSISTIRSISYNEDGKEILIPTISDEGKVMEDEEAIAYWKKKGADLKALDGKDHQFNLGVYDTIEEANAAAEKIHKQQAGLLRKWSKKK